MTDSDVFDEFERLWQSYRVCVDAASRLTTPNTEDDEFVKMAIVGFSHHQATDAWSEAHGKIARGYLEQFEPEDSATMKKYSLLALGALLGLYSAGKIDDRVYRLGYILLPGFVMGKGAAVDTL